MEYLVTGYDRKAPAGAKRCVLEDSIMRKGSPVTAGSKMLENFISPLDAAVVTRLENAGIAILGKTRLEEFNAAPYDAKDDTPSGAVTAVAEDFADFALCNDVFGTVRRQAARRGLYYLHPTYGTVSRYGLIPAASSMDQIGVAAKTPADAFSALSAIAGRDPADGAMLPDAQYEYTPDVPAGDIKLGLPVNVLQKADAADSTAVSDFAKAFPNKTELELPYFDVYAQVLHILAYAEISNNLTRYDGVKFGYRADGYRSIDELYTKTRTEAFGQHVKLASIMGAFVLSQENYSRFYDKAMRLRRLIRDSACFSSYDVLVLPSPGSGGYQNSAFHALPQLAGLPSLTLPFSGGAVQLVAAAGCENALYSAVKAVSL